MKKTNKTILRTAAAVLYLLAVLPVLGAAAEVTFKGNVTYLNQGDITLEKKFETAFKEFKQGKKFDAYFTGYTYVSRHDIRFGNEGASGEPFNLYTEEDKIKIRRTRTNSFNLTTDSENKGESPVGIIFLHEATNGKIIDTSQIDLEETFNVEDYPLFWFGEVDNNDSFNFLTKEFEKSESSIQNEYIFLIGSHVHPQAETFLYNVALGDYPSKTREQAIFWLGSNKYDKSFEYLKDIYKKEDSNKMREKVVFSFYLIGDDAAVKELIQIAKNETSAEVRKQSIFWLGQKATEESVKALKAVVDDTNEETQVKQSAVFALSQLPKDRSVPMLIDIARSNDNPKVRENAIFWLGQKDDKAALAFFEEILLKKK
ncbi:MAG: HEAT repeat domain-containing protein [Candidatus Aminicenantes bacterium]|nr:HEAT repeat domain-containing protein [Candidatus Aminicenantes bacterium]